MARITASPPGARRATAMISSWMATDFSTASSSVSAFMPPASIQANTASSCSRISRSASAFRIAYLFGK